MPLLLRPFSPHIDTYARTLLPPRPSSPHQPNLPGPQSRQPRPAALVPLGRGRIHRPRAAVPLLDDCDGDLPGLWGRVVGDGLQGLCRSGNSRAYRLQGRAEGSDLAFRPWTTCTPCSLLLACHMLAMQGPSDPRACGAWPLSPARYAVSACSLLPLLLASCFRCSLLSPL